MTTRWFFPLAVVLWVGLLFGATLGPWSWALPSLSCAAVFVTARRSARDSHRGLALWLGLVSGVFVESAFLMPVIFLLVLGGLARATRLLLPLEGWGRLFVAGCSFAGLELLLWSFLPGTQLRVSSVARQAAFLSIPLTGILAVLLDAYVHAEPRIRHVMSRP